MVGDNGEAVADEVLSPFLDRRGDGKELSDIRGGSKKPPFRLPTRLFPL